MFEEKSSSSSSSGAVPLGTFPEALASCLHRWTRYSFTTAHRDLTLELSLLLGQCVGRVTPQVTMAAKAGSSLCHSLSL